MRKTLLLSAAALGLAIGTPAFAQTTSTQGTAPSSGMTAGSATAPDTGNSAATTTTAPTHPRHVTHARRSTSGEGQVASGGMVRPGHEPGVGDSEPASNQASNIDRSDTRSVIAPRLPVPATSANATPEQLLGRAQAALRRGRTGEAQEALERAETRALDRSTAPENVSQPDQGPFIRAIGEARRDLANRDLPGTQRAIGNAMSASSYAQSGSSAGMGGAGMSNGMSGGQMSGGQMPGGAMSGGAMSGGAMSGGPMVGSGMNPPRQPDTAYTPPGGYNSLATTGATNGNAVGANTGGPANANGIPGTPSGVSSVTGSNSGGGGGSGGNGGGSGGSGGSSR
jgi:hypothetical protein